MVVPNHLESRVSVRESIVFKVIENENGWSEVTDIRPRPSTLKRKDINVKEIGGFLDVASPQFRYDKDLPSESDHIEYKKMDVVDCETHQAMDILDMAETTLIAFFNADLLDKARTQASTLVLPVGNGTRKVHPMPMYYQIADMVRQMVNMRVKSKSWDIKIYEYKNMNGINTVKEEIGKQTAEGKRIADIVSTSIKVEQVDCIDNENKKDPFGGCVRITCHNISEHAIINGKRWILVTKSKVYKRNGSSNIVAAFENLPKKSMMMPLICVKASQVHQHQKVMSLPRNGYVQAPNQAAPQVPSQQAQQAQQAQQMMTQEQYNNCLRQQQAQRAQMHNSNGNGQIAQQPYITQ